MRRKLERSEPGPEYHQTDQETEVADSVHDEGFIGSSAGRAAFDIEADQKVTADPDQLPKDEDLENVASQHQPQHRKAKERHVGEEEVVAARTVQVPPVVSV